jgi:hypothetical protein
MAAGLQGHAARGLGVFEVLDGGEMAVGQGSIGQRPEMLGRLELRRIRRQEEQVDIVRYAQLDAGMPAGAIQHQDYLLGGTGPHLARELGQFHFKHGNADGGGQMKDGPTGGGVDETNEVAPVVAVLHGHQRALAVEAPDLLEDGLQADAVLIDGPELDARLRESGRDRLDERPNVF